jgi:hypothetical protein
MHILTKYICKAAVNELAALVPADTALAHLTEYLLMTLTTTS